MSALRAVWAICNVRERRVRNAEVEGSSPFRSNAGVPSR